MRAQLVAAVRALLVLTVLVGVAFPLLLTGLAQFAFDDEADGSPIRRDGVIVGSRLIGQAFDADEWFHPRPSAAGDGYDAGASGASNLGPSNDVLLDQVATRVADYRTRNGLRDDVQCPSMRSRLPDPDSIPTSPSPTLGFRPGASPRRGG